MISNADQEVIVANGCVYFAIFALHKTQQQTIVKTSLMMCCSRCNQLIN